MEFKVSVVTPVYNAAKYVRQAVKSAINLPEVGEVILIEDGSPDNALQICQELEQEFDIVKLYQHPNGENRGAGASRNLGIKNAQFDFIAFLDADDWYLPNRFEAEKKLFVNPDIDVVFSNYDKGKISPYLKLINYRSVINQNGSFKYKNWFLSETRLPFHTNSISLRTSKLLQMDKYFDVTLTLHQDSEFFRRIVRSLNCYLGEFNIGVSVVRAHADNRISHRGNSSHQVFLKKHIENLGLENLETFELKGFRRKVIFLLYKDEKLFQNFLKAILGFINPKILLKWYVKNPLINK